MIHITIEDIKQISDENLAELLDLCQKEQKCRDELARTKLISDFHNAFLALRRAGIALKYYEADYDDNYTWITEWDGFDFD